MPISLVPHHLFDHYGEITTEYLKENGIRLLLSDLDFTLAAKSTRCPDQALRSWIAELEAAGIDFMIVSNNRSGARVTEFCADLGVPYQGHAGKPSTRGLKAAMARAGADTAHTAMLGDKPCRSSEVISHLKRDLGFYRNRLAEDLPAILILDVVLRVHNHAGDIKIILYRITVLFIEDKFCIQHIS